MVSLYDCIKKVKGFGTEMSTTINSTTRELNHDDLKLLVKMYMELHPRYDELHSEYQIL